MAVLADVVAGVRQKVRDFSQMFQTDIAGDGLSQIFEFPVVNIEPTTLVVQKIVNTSQLVTVLTSGVDFTLDAHHGMIMMTAGPLDTAHSLNVFGTHYQWFLDTDIIAEAQWWIKAMDESQEDDFLFGTLTTDDPRMELTIRGTLVGALWSLLIEASLDIDVRNPEGVDIPTSQRFAQLQALVQVWTERYQDLSERLNIGIDRIEIMNLRRVSLSTGRLVPLYIEEEFDDQATPRRLFPLIDRDQTQFDPPPGSTILNPG